MDYQVARALKLHTHSRFAQLVVPAPPRLIYMCAGIQPIYLFLRGAFFRTAAHYMFAELVIYAFLHVLHASTLSLLPCTWCTHVLQRGSFLRSHSLQTARADSRPVSWQVVNTYYFRCVPSVSFSVWHTHCLRSPEHLSVAYGHCAGFVKLFIFVPFQGSGCAHPVHQAQYNFNSVLLATCRHQSWVNVWVASVQWHTWCPQRTDEYSARV